MAAAMTVYHLAVRLPNMMGPAKLAGGWHIWREEELAWCDWFAFAVLGSAALWVACHV